MQYAQYTDIPVWVGVLSILLGLAMTVAMGKWAAHRERRRKEIET
jgi:hypothetical protein